MSRRFLAPARSVVSLLLAVAVVGAIDVPAASAAGTINYVALGDSYSAGVGTPDESGSCGRSPSAYPALWTRNHPTALLTFMACGGATIDDVRNNQLSALDASTTLVSITIGGNDAGFFPTVMLCTMSSDADCEQQVTTSRTVISQVLPAKLDAIYQAIRAKAPNATVVVLGYPQLLDPTSDCPGDGMTTFKRLVLNTAADHLARVVSSRAQAAGFRYVDIRGMFDGHAICAATPWLNNVSSTRLTDSFHPNALGYAQGYLPSLSANTGL